MAMHQTSVKGKSQTIDGRFVRHLIGLLVVTIGLLVSIGAHAEKTEPGCGEWLAKLASAQGRVEAYAAMKAAWRDAVLENRFCFGDKVRTWERSRALIHLNNETFVRLNQNTVLAFTENSRKRPDWMEVLQGMAYFISRVPYELNIHTPFVNATIKGTEFAVEVTTEGTRIDVFEGQVVARNDQGEVSVNSNQSALALRGRGPSLQLRLRPENAVQWTLYYPPVVGADPAAYAQSPAITEIREAIGRYRRGDTYGAVVVLDGLAPRRRDATVLELEAGLLLSLGRVEDARQRLDQVIELESEAAEPWALRSIIDLAQDHIDQALSHAREAVARNPRSAAGHRALSYAYQAAFRLDDALAEGQISVDLAQGDASVWARLSELWLMVGDTAAAREAADRAAALEPANPELAVARGFALLMERSRQAAAEASFRGAIRTDSNHPLARFGLALALIKRGDIDGGTEQFSLAAALDPRNSLIRSYLGKAYYEQKRNRRANAQFGLAKIFDPRDPTPWFYEAIQRQTENRPLDAMRELQRAIDLNDNRAVYRSRQLLDSDRAIHGISMARVYDDLGFTRRALVEASKSLSFDPTDASAHRFLSDSYVNQPGLEVAQLSELLQAQLLQPININPVQPHLTVKGLNLFAGVGPGESAFKDFTSSFERDRPRLVASGVWGNNDTQADETVLSGVQGRTSYSLGQFHYHTDGFRPGANVDHDIYNAYLQSEISDAINLQFEYRHRESKQGPELFLDLDPADQRARRGSLGQDIARTGIHLSPNPNHHLLGNFGYVNRRETYFDGDAVDYSSLDDRRDGYVGESEYLFHGRLVDIVAGGGAYSVDWVQPKDTHKDFGFGVDISQETIRSKLVGHNVFGYSNIRLPGRFVGTLGLSYDFYQEQGQYSKSTAGGSGDQTYGLGFDRSRVNPKIGMQWDLTDSLRLRGAYLQTLKRPLIVDQTVEPTQVAGFNQFFDLFNGSASELYGAALDATVFDGGFLGLEFTRKNIWTPQRQENQYRDSFRREDTYRAYANWVLGRHWAVTTEYRRDLDSLSTFELDSQSVPLAIKYFHDSGLFAQAGPTWVRQNKVYIDGSRYDSEFLLLDAAVGYRLPKRRGILSLEMKNLLNEQFLYQDSNFKASDPFNVIQSVVASRTIMGRLVLSF